MTRPRDAAARLAPGACLALAAPAAAQAPAPPADARVAGIDSLVRAFHAAGRFSGAVLVGEGGRVLYEGGAGEANREWHLSGFTAGFWRMDDGRTIVVLDNTMSPAVADLQRAVAEIVYAGGEA